MKTENKVKHEYKCQAKGCKNPAKYNLQSGGFVLWRIDDTEGFERLEEWDLGANTNEFWCEAHAEEQKII